MTIQNGVVKISSATSLQIDLPSIDCKIINWKTCLVRFSLFLLERPVLMKIKGLICHFLVRVGTCHGVIFPLTTLPPVKDEQILNSEVLWNTFIYAEFYWHNSATAIGRDFIQSRKVKEDPLYLFGKLNKAAWKSACTLSTMVNSIVWTIFVVKHVKIFRYFVSVWRNNNYERM